MHLGSRGRNKRRRHNQKKIGLYCARLVYFLRTSTEFHVMRMECQIIIIHFLILISHKLPAISKRCPLPIFPLPVFDHSPITPQSLPDHSPIIPRSNRASFYPPIFDTLEWMEMQTGIPLYLLLKLYFLTSSLPQRLKT